MIQQAKYDPYKYRYSKITENLSVHHFSSIDLCSTARNSKSLSSVQQTFNKQDRGQQYERQKHTGMSAHFYLVEKL